MEDTLTTGQPSETIFPSCEGCRKRKLKCPRQQPSCATCDRLGTECVYDYEKKKPGFKVGAIESLNRRLELVEKSLLDGQHTKNPRSPASDAQYSNLNTPQSLLSPFVGALGLLTNELRTLSTAISSNLQQESTQKYRLEQTHSKRRRVDCDTTTVRTWPSEPQTPNASTPDPTEQAAIDAYFRFIQPWISIVHEPSFLNEVRNPAGKLHLQVLVHVMMLATSHFTRPLSSDQSRDHTVTKAESSDIRSTALASIMGDICVVNVQALLILVFLDIADDQVTTADSLLGIAWKHIERLGVFEQLYKPGPSENTDAWIDAEEQRRVFWNAFMLDRLCAALLERKPTSFNITSIPQLPACGSFWYTNQQRRTPCLPLSDPAKGGLHIPFITSAREKTSVSPQEDSGLGALAFYVESVESLSIIMSHFLSLEVNYTDSSEVSLWLMRLRDLDQQLMLWKTRLPQQWIDSGVSRRGLPGIMDPAMTAANATHNTCLILLHNKIAYPDARLSWVRLPSACSAETCYNGAVEVCTIIRKYLQQRRPHHPLSPQLGYCAYVSAKSLLTHWRTYAKPLASEFWILVNCLDDMAQRWQPHEVTQKLPLTSLFAKMAGRLRALHTNYVLDPAYSMHNIRPLCEAASTYRRNIRRHWVTPDMMATYIERCRSELAIETPLERDQTTFIASSSLPDESITAAPMNTQTARHLNGNAVLDWDSHTMEPSETNPSDDNLLAISESLMGPGFTDMDRIVTFDDAMLGIFPETGMNWDFS